MISFEYVKTALLSVIAGMLGGIYLHQTGDEFGAIVMPAAFIGWAVLILVYALYQDIDNLYLVGDSA